MSLFSLSGENFCGYILESCMSRTTPIYNIPNFNYNDPSINYKLNTRKKLVMKLIPNSDTEGVSEIEMLSLLSHPNILSPLEYCSGVIKDQIVHGIVMEKANGDLGSYLDQMYDEGIPEDKCKIIAFRLLNALSYIHGLGIVHRDIKPGNILYFEDYEQTRPPNPILADFGLAVQLNDSGETCGIKGTYPFMAPEVIQGKNYGAAADMWSLGVTLYSLFTNTLLFNVSGFMEIKLEITSNSCHERICSDITELEISDDAKDFLSKLIHPDPDYRLAASDAVSHTWFHNIQEQIDNYSTNQLIPDYEDDIPFL